MAPLPDEVELAPPLSPPSADEVRTPAAIGNSISPPGFPPGLIGIGLFGTAGGIAPLQTPVVAFFKVLTVDDVIGDSDLNGADFGGSDSETILADLTFTLTSLANYGTLILLPFVGPPVNMVVGITTFTSADSVVWVATDVDVSARQDRRTDLTPPGVQGRF